MINVASIKVKSSCKKRFEISKKLFSTFFSGKNNKKNNVMCMCCDGWYLKSIGIGGIEMLMKSRLFYFILICVLYKIKCIQMVFVNEFSKNYKQCTSFCIYVATISIHSNIKAKTRKPSIYKSIRFNTE